MAKKMKRPYIGEITATRIPGFVEQERGFQFDSSKVCFRCKVRPRGPSHPSYCRACINEYMQERYAADPQKARAEKRAWHAANREKVLAQQRARQRARYAADPQKARAKGRAQGRAWRAANREKALAQSRARRAANPEKVLAQGRAWRAANHEKLLARARAWYAAHREEVLPRMRAWYAANRGKVLSDRGEIGPECCWPS